MIISWNHREIKS